MKSVLSLLIVMIPCLLFATGVWGEYTVKGCIHYNSNLVANDTINVAFQDSIYRVVTDSKGNFTFTIGWHSACRSGKSRFQVIKINRQINQKYIHIFWNDKSVQFRNRWRKYKNETISMNFKLK